MDYKTNRNLLLTFNKSIQATQTINQFCAEKTHNKIAANCIQSENVQSDIAAMLINAIYFKGTWKYKFHKTLTNAGDFYVNENGAVRINFMKLRSNLFYMVKRVESLGT